MPPLWIALKPADLAKLIQFQYEHYGENLLDSLETEKSPPVTTQCKLEDTEEIAHIMEKPPASKHELEGAD